MGTVLRKAGLFTGVTYLLSFLFIGAFVLFGGEWNTPGAMVTASIYMFIPGLVAFVLTKYVDGDGLRDTLALRFRPNRWFFVAWIGMALIVLATAEVGYELPWHTYSPGMEGFLERLGESRTPEQVEAIRQSMQNVPVPIFWLLLVQGLIAGITVNLLFALGEETGWRGYLQTRLEPLGFWRSSWLIGLIWGVWHAPIILQGHNYPEHPVAGAGMMIVFCLLAGPLHSYVRMRARSVVAAGIMHGTLNGLAGLPLVFTAGGSDLTAGVTGLAGFITLAAANVLMFLGERFLADEPFAFTGEEDAAVQAA